MSNKEERFVLYEYLLYFWKKKWAFLIIPIITIVLAIAVNYLYIKPGHSFTGESIIYTGSVNTPVLTNPENLKDQYKAELKDTGNIFVPGDGYLKVRFEGDDRDSVAKNLSELTEEIEKVLVERYNFLIGETKTNLERLEGVLMPLEEFHQMYKAEVNKEDPNISDVEYLTAMLEAENYLKKSTISANSMNNDIALFEKPKALNTTVGPTKTYTIESALIGLILGLILTVALLTLLRYIERAKRYNDSK